MSTGPATHREPARLARLLLLAIAAFLLLALIWAALARVETSVSASGKVIPSARLQTVSHLEGGVVALLHVRAGDRVAKGAPLITLSPAQAQAELGRNESGNLAARARLARLTAETQGAAPLFPADLQQAAPDAVAAERALFAARSSELAAARAAALADVAAAREQVRQAEASRAARAGDADAAARERDLLRPLVEKRIEPAIEGLRAENRAASTAATARAADAELARARATLARAEADRAAVDRSHRARALAELAATGADASAGARGMEGLRDRLQRTEIRAPIAGTIQRLLVSTVGAAVRPGEPLAEIVPTGDRLLVEAAISPRDIAFVAVGQPARVRLSAYDFAVYGALDGRVEAISPDASRNPESGADYFTVRVAVDDAVLRRPDGTALPVGVGMQADVALVGDRRSILSYLLAPLVRLQSGAFRER